MTFDPEDGTNLRYQWDGDEMVATAGDAFGYEETVLKSYSLRGRRDPFDALEYMITIHRNVTGKDDK